MVIQVFSPQDVLILRVLNLNKFLFKIKFHRIIQKKKIIKISQFYILNVVSFIIRKQTKKIHNNGKYTIMKIILSHIYLLSILIE